jgi:hypothetical protein
METQALEVDAIENKNMETWLVDVMKEGFTRSKILAHFIKGKIAPFHIETFFSIFNKLEYLKN